MSREELMDRLDTALDGIPNSEEWGDASVIVVGDGHHVREVSGQTDLDEMPYVLIELG